MRAASVVVERPPRSSRTQRSTTVRLIVGLIRMLEMEREVIELLTK